VTVKIAGSTPDGDKNGLTAVLAQLIHRPERIHVAVVLLDTKSLSTDVDTGDVTPTVRLRAIEVFEADTAEAVRAREMLRQRYARRTDRPELPFDIAGLLDAAAVDQDGVIHDEASR
jgi:hypothetical protein